MIEIDDYADTVLAQQISQLAGVAQVFIAGEQKRAVRVQVDPAKLAAMGLTLEDVRSVLVNATVNAPKGTIDTPQHSLAIYDNDQMTQASEYENVILGWKSGAPIRVRDIGRAVDAPENAYLGGLQNGQRGIILMVFKQPGANVIDTVERIKAKLPALEAAIPPSVKVSTIVDRTQTIRASVSDVQFTLLLSISLVVMVIFLFLRNVWATIIPSITVPVALICTFAVMYLMDYSLDNLSLMALTIAVGFVVDDAIVMLENIFRHIEDGMRPMEAAIKGAGEIGFTIVSISCSLIAVFIPLLLMGGIVGRLFREFAMTVTIAVVVSMVVSLTLTPMMCSRFLHHHQGGHNLMYRVIEKFFIGMIAGYRRTLDVALRFRFITLLVFFATMGLSAYLFVTAPKGFFPPQDTGVIIGTTEGAQDISVQAHVRIAAETGRCHRPGPGYGSLCVQCRHRHQRADHQQRPGVHRIEAVGSAQGRVGAGLHRPQPGEAGQGRGRSVLHAGDPRCPRRRPHLQDRIPVHAAGCRPCRTQHLGAQGAGADEVPADAARRDHRPADRRNHHHPDDRPRPGGAVRRAAAGDRRHAV